MVDSSGHDAAESEPQRRTAAETRTPLSERQRDPERPSANQDAPTMAGNVPLPDDSGTSTQPPPAIHSGTGASNDHDSARVVNALGSCPTRFGDYELIREVARGGMGVVYQARQISLHRIVALKMILAGQLASAEDIRRFQVEAEAAANMDHPGIVPIYEVGCHADQHYFSMGYVEGPSLAELVKHGPLDPYQAARLVEQVATAVDYAHGHGIIHRDLKPANILLECDTGFTDGVLRSANRSSADSKPLPHPTAVEARPRITDFGLAKRVANDANLTATGEVLGTPSYMAPEQASGKLVQVGVAADVYALGAVLYTCLTGRPPFQAATSLDTVMQVIDEDPVPPREISRSIPRDLETIALKCLRKDPHDRYDTAEALAKDLANFRRGDPIVAKPLSYAGRLYRWARHYPALAVTCTALLLFYANHLFNMFVLQSPTETMAFHWFTTWLAILWATGASAFQVATIKLRSTRLVVYAWTGMDVLLFTSFLSVADGPRSTVIMGYLLLIAGAALRFRTGVVWFVAALSTFGYISLVWDAHQNRPQFAPSGAAVFPFVLSLLLLATALHFLVRRVRTIDGAAEKTERLSDPGTKVLESAD